MGRPIRSRLFNRFAETIHEPWFLTLIRDKPDRRGNIFKKVYRSIFQNSHSKFCLKLQYSTALFFRTIDPTITRLHDYLNVVHTSEELEDASTDEQDLPGASRVELGEPNEPPSASNVANPSRVQPKPESPEVEDSPAGEPISNVANPSRVEPNPESHEAEDSPTELVEPAEDPISNPSRVEPNPESDSQPNPSSGIDPNPTEDPNTQPVIAENLNIGEVDEEQPEPSKEEPARSTEDSTPLEDDMAASHDEDVEMNIKLCTFIEKSDEGFKILIENDPAQLFEFMTQKMEKIFACLKDSTFTYYENNKKVKIEVGANHEIHLKGRLSLIYSLPPILLPGETYISTYCVDPYIDFRTLYLYSDLIEETLLGESFHPVLQAVSLQIGNLEETQHTVFHTPLFLKLNRTHIVKFTVYLYNEIGQKVNFVTNTPSLIKLLFKKL